ncbi:phosphatidate cytidylyltransferase [Sphingobacterium oryzagri]|uniref:Phosphatidate cytidylyltransferase n=1 Tax=Sphingobacterium oryzagri TaxID=3025669 RepID=A0ABY7WGR8_9SPHI|nr:phosphatidate cytidylyltransferase [Sphingobacterium sp. KACC 22765]WDF68791.1 phosphatidate cytidylyltransferase [Sphingobacterium sp. KACC 22765]
MKTRAITGFFFIAVLIAVVLFGPYAFIPFFTLVGVYSVYEFYEMVQSGQTKPLWAIGIFSALLGLCLLSLVLLDMLATENLLWIFAFAFVLYIAALFRKTVSVIHDIAYTLFGLLYVAIPFGLFICLGFVSGTYDPYIPLGFLILLWTNDTGAYLAGKSFGRRKLFERISPNKTWEGFIGGLVLAVAVSLNLARYFDSLVSWQWLTMAIIIGSFGTLGDLVESMLKRNTGVKDSGKLLPGHGGLLDRFDGLLMAAPLVYLFLKFFVF